MQNFETKDFTDQVSEQSIDLKGVTLTDFNNKTSDLDTKDLDQKGGEIPERVKKSPEYKKFEAPISDLLNKLTSLNTQDIAEALSTNEVKDILSKEFSFRNGLKKQTISGKDVMNQMINGSKNTESTPGMINILEKNKDNKEINAKNHPALKYLTELIAMQKSVDGGEDEEKAIANMNNFLKDRMTPVQAEEAKSVLSFFSPRDDKSLDEKTKWFSHFLEETIIINSNKELGKLNAINEQLGLTK